MALDLDRVKWYIIQIVGLVFTSIAKTICFTKINQLYTPISYSDDAIELSYEDLHMVRQKNTMKFTIICLRFNEKFKNRPIRGSPE